MEDDNYVDAVLEDCRDKMAKALEHTRAEFATIRTGRAAPALVLAQGHRASHSKF
jgi:ribosome recycling factor